MRVSRFGIGALLGVVGPLAAASRPSAGQTVAVPPAPPTGVSALAWRQVPGAAAGLAGLVVRMDSLTPLPDALVRIADSAGVQLWQGNARPSGRVVWPAPSPGRYIVTVVRIGYAAARAQVEVPRAGGVEFTAVLAPQPSERLGGASTRTRRREAT